MWQLEKDKGYMECSLLCNAKDGRKTKVGTIVPTGPLLMHRCYVN